MHTCAVELWPLPSVCCLDRIALNHQDQWGLTPSLSKGLKLK